MSQQISSIISLALLFAPLPTSSWAQNATDSITRIAFGSCCHQSRSQAIWPAITAKKPDLFLFLGDNVYGDTERMDLLKEKYGRLLSEPGYRALQDGGCRVLATWDDHDYGQNDAGAEYPKKVESQRIFLESFGVPKERAPWTRPGIYDAYEFGPAGRRVQIILLDTRYFRSELIRMKVIENRILGRYAENPDPKATILGEEQWTWLEAQLQKPADIRVIASSIQILAKDHFWERWQNFPKERDRFFELLKLTKAQNVVLLSGDRHLAEVMEMKPDDPLSPGYRICEITSSGLNQTFDRGGSEPNRYRIGDNFTGANFGLLSIDWQSGSIHAEICDLEGKPVLETRIAIEPSESR